MDQNSKKFKNKRIIVIIIFLALLLLLSVLFNNNKDGERTDNGETFQDVEDQSMSKELSPEEVIARMNEEDGIGIEQGSVKVEIISPEEEIFYAGQARHYQAQVLGLVNGSRCSCDWKFYLNENNEEYLYQEMEDRGCSVNSYGEGHICGFTTTFIENIGELRVHVDIEVKKGGEIVQRAETDRMYKVR
jgi:hypothetical protein